MIYIENRRCKEGNLKKNYPDAVVLDLTSKSEYAQKLSPFYPHGGIPVPLSPEGATSMSVEGIWQGLKVFEDGRGIDPSRFRNDTMRGIKRTVRTLGRCLGHLAGTRGDYDHLLGYVEARKQIYLPAYRWILENVPDVQHLLERIGREAQERDLVFLDYNTNDNVDNPRKPLSHASLVRDYIYENYPGASERHSTLPPAKPKARRR